MLKRALSPVILPPPKRAHLSVPPIIAAQSTSFESLYDELILHIFTFLSHRDLCTLQATNRDCARLSLDNQLWKSLYVREFGRLRLRGFRGYAGRRDEREIKSLPGRVATEIKDWKRMFRISTNWRNGRCHTSTLDDLPAPLLTGSPREIDTPRRELEPNIPQITITGKYTIISPSEPAHRPSIIVLSPSVPMFVIHVAPVRAQELVRITALAVDQSSRTSTSIAACVSNGDIYAYELRSSSHKHHYVPPFKTPRTAPITQVAYGHPLLVTLSESFSLSVYDLSHETMQVVHVLTSFTSFPPSSLVLTIPEPQTYKLLLTYASPVYPAHWSVGVTEVILSSATLRAPTDSLTSPARQPPLHLSTRSTRAFDLPADWIDETKLRNVREQWSRKVGSVASTQTDGRWVVLAPAAPGEACPPGGFTPASLPLQLYRLSLPSPRAGSSAAPKLTFVRNLRGQKSPVSALALSDGRCVGLGVDGSVWVWDLENGSGAEVTGEASEPSAELCPSQRGTIAFDERRIITPGAMGTILVRDFDI